MRKKINKPERGVQMERIFIMWGYLKIRGGIVLRELSTPFLRPIGFHFISMLDDKT